MAVAAGVGSGDDVDPGGERPADALQVMRAQRTGALAHVGRRRFAVVLVDRQRRDERDPALRHHRNQLTILVEVAAVLDRVDAGFDRHAQPGPAHRVAHDPTSEQVGLVDQRLHLVQRERAVARAVTGTRAGAAGGSALDHVGARPDHGPHRRAHRLDAVGDARGHARIVAARRRVARRAHAVAEAAGRRDDRERHDQARPRDEAVANRQPEARVETAGVAHRRVARLEDLARDRGGAQVPRALRLVQAPALRQLVAVEGQMVVAIDEPGHRGETRGVDHVDAGLGAGRPTAARVRRGHRLDPSVVDHHARVAHGRRAAAVDQGADSDDLHGCLPPSSSPTPR